MKGRKSIRASSAIDIVEAAYRLDGTESEWLEGLLAHAAADLELGCGVYAYTLDERAPEHAGMVFAQRDLDMGFGSRLLDLNEKVLPPLCAIGRTRLTSCGGLEQFLGASSPVVADFRSLLAPSGIKDGFSASAQDTEGGSVTLCAPSRDVSMPPPRVRGIWRRVALHVASALRLRRKLVATATGKEARRDALLDPSGKFHDVEGTLKDDTSARGVLIEAVKAMEHARGADMRASPARALELWQGLVGGEWSLVEHWESAGRRYLAAYQNRPELRDPRGLNPLERSILKYLALGGTNKDIMFALGLPSGTVSAAVTQILKKLKVPRRVDLAVLADPSRMQRLDLSVDGCAVGVLSVDVRPREAAVEALSAAEREVATFVVRGYSNDRIAKERRVSSRTVANQLRTIFDKLGVTTRSQLARAMTQ